MSKNDIGDINFTKMELFRGLPDTSDHDRRAQLPNAIRIRFLHLRSPLDTEPYCLHSAHIEKLHPVSEID